MLLGSYSQHMNHMFCIIFIVTPDVRYMPKLKCPVKKFKKNMNAKLKYKSKMYLKTVLGSKCTSYIPSLVILH